MALAFLFTNNQENGKGNQMIWTEPFEGILKVPCNQVTVYWYVLLLVDKINWEKQLTLHLALTFLSHLRIKCNFTSVTFLSKYFNRISQMAVALLKVSNLAQILQGLG